MLPLSGTGKNTCRKMFITYAHLLTGGVRDDNFDDAWKFVCSLYGIGEKVSEVLMVPTIGFFVFCIASRVTYHKGKLLG